MLVRSRKPIAAERLQGDIKIGLAIKCRFDGTENLGTLSFRFSCTGYDATFDCRYFAFSGWFQ